MKTIRVMTIFGTRPEAIKMAPLVKELEGRAGVESLCCVTAQHREMLDSVLHIFQLTPQYDLNIMEPRQTLSTITSKCLLGVEQVLQEAKPDLVLVHGDTSTTFSGALAAFYQRVMVGHVEAGLRTYDKYSPFPEEMNRKLVGDIADLHFCPTRANRANLEREGITVSSTYIRTLVAQGEMDRAVEFLGHPHVLTNRVTHGKKIGSSSLGFPTVNLQVPPQVIVPAFGVYATRVWVEGRSYIAVTNVGVRPTVEDNDGRVTVEGFILDFDGDLYGKELRMEFYHRIRGEQKFPSLQELSQEIRRNAEETRAYFLAASQDAPGAR